MAVRIKRLFFILSFLLPLLAAGVAGTTVNLSDATIKLYITGTSFLGYKPVDLSPCPASLKDKISKQLGEASTNIYCYVALSKSHVLYLFEIESFRAEVIKNGKNYATNAEYGNWKNVQITLQGGYTYEGLIKNLELYLSESGTKQFLCSTTISASPVDTNITIPFTDLINCINNAKNYVTAIEKEYSINFKDTPNLALIDPQQIGEARAGNYSWELVLNITVQLTPINPNTIQLPFGMIGYAIASKNSSWVVQHLFVFDTASMGQLFAKQTGILANGMSIGAALSIIKSSFSQSNVLSLIQSQSCWLRAEAKLGIYNLQQACQALDAYVKKNWQLWFEGSPPQGNIYVCEKTKDNSCSACVLNRDLVSAYVNEWPIPQYFTNIKDILTILDPQAQACTWDESMYTIFDGFYQLIKNMLPQDAREKVFPAIIATVSAFLGLWLVIMNKLLGVNLSEIKNSNEEKMKLIASAILTLFIVNLIGGAFNQLNTFSLLGLFLLLVGLYVLWMQGEGEEKHKHFATHFIIIIIITSIIVSGRFLSVIGADKFLTPAAGRVYLINPTIPFIGPILGPLTRVDLRFVVVMGYVTALYLIARAIAQKLFQRQ